MTRDTRLLELLELPMFTDREIEEFQKNGYLIARQFTSEELLDRMIAATKKGIEEQIAPIEYETDLHYPGAPAARSKSGGETPRRLKQALARDSVFRDWVTQPELNGRLQQLMNPPVVMSLAHHNCIMTKMPQFSSDTGWHQDIRYWSFSKPELISVWLALEKEHAENGCLKLIPGSHSMKIDKSQLDEELFFRTDLEENRELLEEEIHAELEPGDVLFFHCRMLHAADRNRTNHPKFSVVFTFRSLENNPIAGTRSEEMPELLLPKVEIG